MIKKSLLYYIIYLCCFSVAAFAGPPMSLGGFTLGSDINDYEDLMELETCQGIKYQEYLGEGIIKSRPGFKSGSISYGLCDKVNKIVRIKLKFSNPSKKFFKDLLDKYKEHLGPPTEYQGDPFQTFIAWKWSFEGEDGRRISLILQHNLKDIEEKIGNAVKMTLWDQVEKEKACYEAKNPRKETPEAELSPKEMWNLYIPL